MLKKSTGRKSQGQATNVSRLNHKNPNARRGTSDIGATRHKASANSVKPNSRATSRRRPQGSRPLAQSSKPTQNTAINDFIQRLHHTRDAFKEVRRLRTRYRVSQREAVAECYAIASGISEDDNSWANFRAEYKTEFNISLKSFERQDALKLVLRYAVGGEGKQASKQVSLFYRAVQPLFERGEPAPKIADIIKSKGGFTALAAAHAKRHPAPRSSAKIKQNSKRPSRLKPGGCRRLDQIVSGADAGSEVSLAINATLVGEGKELLSIPKGAEIRLAAHLLAVQDGEYNLKIYNAARV